MPPAVKLAAANARGQRSILTLSPRKLIRNLPLTHPLGLTLSLPLNRPSGFPIYVAAAQLASFPSMSSAPVELPEGDTSLALAHYQAGFLTVALRNPRRIDPDCLLEGNRTSEQEAVNQVPLDSTAQLRRECNAWRSNTSSSNYINDQERLIL